MKLERHFRIICTAFVVLLIFLPGSKAGFFDGIPLSNYELLVVGILLIAIWFFPWVGHTKKKAVIYALVSLSLLNVVGYIFLPYGWSLCLTRSSISEKITSKCEPSAEFRKGEMSYLVSKISYHGRYFPLYFMNGRSFNYYLEGQPDREKLEYGLKAFARFAASGRDTISIKNTIPGARIVLNGEKKYIASGEEDVYKLPPDKESTVEIYYLQTERSDDHYIDIKTTAPPYYSAQILKKFFSFGVQLYRVLQFIFWAIIFFSVVHVFYTIFISFPRHIKIAISILPIWLVYGYLANIGPYAIFTITVMAIIWFYLSQREEDRKMLLPYIALSLFICTYLFVSLVNPYGKLVLFSGGNDELGHEGFSREVLLAQNFQQFAEGGEKMLFYYQPAHRYFLALLHKVAGESMWGPYVIQTLVAVFAVFVSLSYLKRLSFAAATSATFVFGIVFSQPLWSLFYLTQTPYQQAISTPLLIISLFSLLNFLQLKYRGLVVHAVVGLLIGVAIGVRLDLAPVVLALPLYLLLAKHIREDKKLCCKIVIIFLIAVSILPALIIIRNLVVAKEFYLFPTSTMVNVLPEFRDELPYIAGPSKVTGGDVIVSILKEHSGRYGEMFRAIMSNVFENFTGLHVMRRMLWLATMPAVMCAFIMAPRRRVEFLYLVVVFLVLLATNSFFLPHNGIAMMAQFDFLVVVITCYGFGELSNLIAKNLQHNKEAKKKI